MHTIEVSGADASSAWGNLHSSLPDREDPGKERLGALCVAGEDAFDNADLAGAVCLWSEALALCNARLEGCAGTASEVLVRAQLLLFLGVVHHENSEPLIAQEWLEAAYHAGEAFPDELMDDFGREEFCADVLVNLGNVWQSLGHVRDSEALYAEAIGVYRRRGGGAPVESALKECQARVNLANSLVRRHELAAARDLYVDAVHGLESLVHDGVPHAAQALATVLCNLAALCFDSGDTARARKTLTRAKHFLPATSRATSPPRTRAATAGLQLLDHRLSVRRVASAREGVGIREALHCFESLVDLGHSQYRLDVALCRLAIAHTDPGFQHALDHAQIGIEILCGLLPDGGTHVMATLAGAFLELGCIYANGRVLRSAARACWRAWAIADALCEAAPETSARLKAAAVLNLGVIHARRRRLAKARRHFESCWTIVQRMRDTLADTVALDKLLFRCVSNLGSVQRCAGDYAGSLRSFREIEVLRNSHPSRHGLSHDPGYCQFGDTFHLLGRFEQALAITDAAGACTPHERPPQSPQDLALGLLASCNGVRHAWELAASHDGEVLDAAGAARLLAPAVRAGAALAFLQSERADLWLSSSERMLESVGHAVALLQFLAKARTPRIMGDWVGLRMTVAQLCLKLVSAWLRRSDAGDLECFRQEVDRVSTCLQASILDLDDPALAASWFLRTQGLRTQREALASAGRDASTAWWNALDCIDLDAIGAMASGQGGGPQAQADRLRRACRMAIQRRIESAGAKQAPMYLVLDEVTTRMSPQEALVLLARAVDDRLVVIAISADRVQHEVLDVPELGSRDCRVDLQCVDASLNAQAPTVRKAGSTPRDAMPSADATGEDEGQHRLEKLATCMLRSVQRLLGSATRLSIVPSGDLHVVPWHEAIARAWPSPVHCRVYPTVADWWRLGAEVPASDGLPRWMIASYDAADTGDQADRLYWVRVEATMSRMLWRRTGIEPEEWSCLSEGPAQARPSGATALLACGHGMTLEGNPSRTGVWIATQGDRRRTPKLLSSQDLWRMPAVRRMLLNCCVLGRTSEAMGEPLGLVAQAFGRGAHFVLGALVRLGDLEAALFGLAYQFRLAAAYAAGTGAVDWVDEFLELQGGLRARRWPDGFASWLGTHLPLALQAVVPDVDAARADDDAFEARQSWCRLFDRVLRNCGASLSPPRVSEHWHDFYPLLAGVLAQEPPKSLRRVAPWMVVLGR